MNTNNDCVCPVCGNNTFQRKEYYTLSVIDITKSDFVEVPHKYYQCELCQRTYDWLELLLHYEKNIKGGEA